MKLFLLGILLVSMNSFSSIRARTYKGQSFAIENTIACQKEFKRITQKLENLPGFYILGGGCLPSRFHSNLLEIRFDFESPQFTTIDEFKVNVGLNQECSALGLKIEQTITSSKNTFITSFCKKNILNVHYINDTISYRTSIAPAATFSSKSSCEKQLRTIYQATTNNNFHPLLDFCSYHKKRNTDFEYYKLRLVYFAHENKSIEVLTGKVVRNNCLKDSLDTNRLFEEANIELLHQFCSDKLDFNQSREYLVYLNPSRFNGSIIKSYVGFSQQSQILCLREIEDIRVKFDKMKRKTLYSFCERRGDQSFTSNIYYKQMK